MPISAIIAKVLCLIPVLSDVYSIKHFVLQFVFKLAAGGWFIPVAPVLVKNVN